MKTLLTKINNFFHVGFSRDKTASPISSIVSASLGLLFGFVLLLVFSPGNFGKGVQSLLTAGLTNIPKLLYGTSILLINGLAISVAYKCGLFNIGCSGQFTVGALFSLMFAHGLDAPWYVCLLMGVVGGGLMGSIVGFLKAYFNVNEVISSIMLNYIGLFVTNLIFTNMFNLRSNESMGQTIPLSKYHPGSIIPHLDARGYLSLTIIIAVIAAIIVFIVLNKTTTGYELKGVGFNRNAAKYAGINNRKNIILAMVISGGLAGLAGGCQYLSGIFQYNVQDVILADGFNGISVAFLANCNPIGCIFSALFIYYVTMAQSTLQIYGYSTELVTIIIGSIIYLSAFALIIKNIVVSQDYRTRIRSSFIDRHYKIYLFFNGKYKSNLNTYLSSITEPDKKEVKKAKELDSYYQNSKITFINTNYYANKNTLNTKCEVKAKENYDLMYSSILYLSKLEKESKKASITLDLKKIYIEESFIKNYENISIKNDSETESKKIHKLVDELVDLVNAHYKNISKEIVSQKKIETEKLKEEHKVTIDKALTSLKKGEAI